MNENDILSEVSRIEAALGLRFPPKYIRFLIGEVGELEYLELTTKNGDNIYIYNVCSILERNTTYTIQQLVPQYLLIGQDGDLGFFIKGIVSDENIYSLDLGALGSLDMDLEAIDIYTLGA